MSRRPSTRVVALTGPRSGLGRRLHQRLEQEPSVAEIVCLDTEPTGIAGPKTRFRRVDLTHSTAAAQLSEHLSGAKVTDLAHLAFLSATVRNPASAHELEAIGTLQVFTACESAGVRHVIMPSSTSVYGASPGNPSFLAEDRALLGAPNSRWISDRVEAEAQARRFASAHPEATVSVLRFAALVGADLDNPITRLLKQRVVPTLWGYDPLVQTLHPDDAVGALLAATLSNKPGVFNIAGDGVLPLSSVIRLCGTRALPLPHPVARSLVRALGALGVANLRPSLIDYMRYPWVADTRRMVEGLGFRPLYSTRAALLDFARGRAAASALNPLAAKESTGQPA